MKTVFNNRELAHVWARNTQPTGRASNFFFDGDKIYSYGRHFCIARRLPSGVIAVTQRDYSNSTARHKAYVRQAISHCRKVYCHNPDNSASSNRLHAMGTIEDKLREAQAPRKRDATRDRLRCEAAYCAQMFNEYLEALPADERGDAEPIPQNFADVQAAIDAETERKEAARKREAAQVAEALEQWKNGGPYSARFRSLPVALRIVRGKGLYGGGLRREGKSDVIETSHGAEVPADVAAGLWEMALRCAANNMEMRGDLLPTSRRDIGGYTLDHISHNGDARIGCHLIPFAEMQRIAPLLGLEA